MLESHLSPSAARLRVELSGFVGVLVLVLLLSVLGFIVPFYPSAKTIVYAIGAALALACVMAMWARRLGTFIPSMGAAFSIGLLRGGLLLATLFILAAFAIWLGVGSLTTRYLGQSGTKNMTLTKVQGPGVKTCEFRLAPAPAGQFPNKELCISEASYRALPDTFTAELSGYSSAFGFWAHDYEPLKVN